jgi:hypothetical protein
MKQKGSEAFVLILTETVTLVGNIGNKPGMLTRRLLSPEASAGSGWAGLRLARHTVCSKVRPWRKVERQLKILIKNLAIFLSMSQQAVSAYIIPNSGVGIFSQKTESTNTEAARVN